MKDWLKKLSYKNKEEMKAALRVVLRNLEVCPFNESTGALKIPLGKFKKKGFSYGEVKNIINKVGEEEDDVIGFVDVKACCHRNKKLGGPMLTLLGNSSGGADYKVAEVLSELMEELNIRITIEESDDIILLIVNNLSRLEEIEEELSKGYDEEEPIVPEEEKVYSVKMNSESQSLIVNDEYHISFQSGQEKTQVYKIVCHLWDYRIIKKKGEIGRGGEPVLLENLTKQSNSKNEKAVDRQISRLRDKFAKNNVPIEITSPETGYRQLIVNLEL